MEERKGLDTIDHWLKYKKGRKKKKRSLCKKKNEMLLKRNISVRDEIINDRREAGHVEVDTIHLAGQGCILTAVDRMHRYLSARLLPNRKKETIKKALFEIIHEWKRL